MYVLSQKDGKKIICLETLLGCCRSATADAQKPTIEPVIDDPVF